MQGRVDAVHRSAGHTFSKRPVGAIELVAGIGVAGDAHAGATVRHRSRVARDPTQPNLRQLHLIHGELLDELSAAGFGVAPGLMGENVTTRGVDLLALGCGTHLRLGAEAVVEITGLRNPCTQLDRLQTGLRTALLGRDADGCIVRRAGVMAIVVVGGRVARGDAATIDRVPHVHLALDVV